MSSLNSMMILWRWPWIHI